MRFRSYMAAGALALMPVLALAGQAATAPAAQPMFVNVNGQAVIGWQLDLAQSSGQASMRVRKDALPSDAVAGACAPARRSSNCSSVATTVWPRCSKPSSSIAGFREVNR